jgi:resuscitation-promoting factor RpfB
MRSVAAAVAALAALPLLVVVIVLGSASGPGAPGALAAAVISAPGAGGGTAAANKKLAASLAAEFGWKDQQQLTCLDELWTRESGWSQTAINGSSGAYGIAQALGHIPGVSVALNRQGDNYPPPFTTANPPPWGNSDPAAQISWGLGYIAITYTTPCGAWAHEEADGFY